jgi:hypothetical protein
MGGFPAYRRVDDPPGVYVFRFHTSSKVYVGASMHLNRRIRTHLKQLRDRKHGNSALQREWAASEGADCLISMRVLAGADYARLCEAENALIRHWFGKVGSAGLLNRFAFARLIHSPKSVV